MKDITAVLVHYDDQASLYKALTSLKSISHRIASTIVLQDQKTLFKKDHSAEQIQFTTVTGDIGKTLNATIKKITSPYLLILQNADYLSSKVHTETLQLSEGQTVLGTYDYHRHIVVPRPLLIRTPFVKKQAFLPAAEIPFKEAILPSWLASVANPRILFKNNLIKQAKKSHATMEKQKFMEKYQLEKGKTNSPSISVMISNFNMEKYVGIAVRSCLLQSEQPNQVIIMDDGSSDNSDKQLERFHNQERVKVYKKKNEGKAKALNDLLPYVTSDFVLELDADDWLDPDAIATIKEQLADLPEDVSVVYGNLRRWKQLDNDILFKGVKKGRDIDNREELLSYHFPLGPRIYRTSSLKKEGGFPIITFQDGRLYEDVSVLNRLIKKYRFKYGDFTVYNVREHKESITKTNDVDWKAFLNSLE